MSNSTRADSAPDPVSSGDNERKVSRLVARLRGTSDSTVSAGSGGGFAHLPELSPPIHPIDMNGLRAQLDREGRGVALLVHVNDKRIDTRDALGSTSTPDEVVDRCCRVWPIAPRWWEEFEDDLPDTIVATMGPPGARLLIGAWPVTPDVSCQKTGEWSWSTTSALPGFAGQVLDPSITFPRATYGTLLIRLDGSWAPSYARIIRDPDQP